MGRIEQVEIGEGEQFDRAEIIIAEQQDFVGPREIAAIVAKVHRSGDQQEAPRAVYVVRQPNPVPNQHG